MATFNPRQFGPVPAELSVVPNHGESWARKWANWWGGATIASPTLSMTQPAAQALRTVRKLVDDPDALTDYYIQETEYTREWVRQVAQAPDDTPVILDASGTAAILTATRMLSYVAVDDSNEFWLLTTNEGGSLVPATLRGKNPNAIDKVMFQPVTSLFYQPEPTLSYPDGVNVSAQIVNIATKSNAELIDEIAAAVESKTTPGLIMLPHVTKTGRILPIREVAQLVDRWRRQGRKVFLVVDDIQGMGRLQAEAVANPMSFCDAYLFSSAKALGGILVASGVVMKQELLEAFVERFNSCRSKNPCLARFQLSPAFEERLDERVFKCGAVSLPEVVSMRAALYNLYIRGKGETFGERRQSQMYYMEARRKEVVGALSCIPGLSVLASSPGRPLVPSIVCFAVHKDSWSASAFKEALQEGNPIVTPSASIGHYVRLDIPEYRSMPSVEVLGKAIAETLR